MDSRHAVSDVAALIGVPARAAMLLALLDGRALPSGLLAQEARISAAAASLHLGKLVHGGLLEVEARGRTRVYRLADARVARALEALGAMSTRSVPAGLTAAQRRLRVARCCYDHLAGRLGVEVVRVLQRDRLIRPGGPGWSLTARGEAWCVAVLGLEVEPLRHLQRAFAPRCLDWTERTDHVAGALGAAMLQAFLAKGWLARGPARRALRITVTGARTFSRWGVDAAVFSS